MIATKNNHNQMIEKKQINVASKNNICFFAACFLFLVHIFLRNFLQINSSDYFVLIISIFAFVALNPPSSMIFYAFLLPFKTGIGMHSITLAFCVVMLIKFFFISGSKVDKHLFLLLVVIGLELVNSLIGTNNFAEWLRFSVYLIWMYIILEILRKCGWNDEIITKTIKFFILGFALASLIVVVKSMSNMSLAGLLNGQIRIGKTKDYTSLDEMIISFHVNELALFCATSMSFLTVLWQRKRLSSLVFVIMLLYFLLVGLLTQSRTFIFAILLLFASIVLLNKKNRLKIIVSIVSIFVIVFAVYKAGYLPVIDSVLERLQANDMSTGNGRTDIMNAYNQVMFDNPIRSLFGFGVIDYRMYSNVGSAHNGTQEMIVSLGIIGSLCLIMWFLYFIKEAFNNNTYKFNKWVGLIPTLVIFLNLQGTQFVSQYHLFCILSFAMMLCSLNTILLKRSK